MKSFHSSSKNSKCLDQEVFVSAPAVPESPGWVVNGPIIAKQAARNLLFCVGCENTPLRLELNSYCDTTSIME